MKDGINITLTGREIGIATAGVKSLSLFKNLEDTGISYAEAELCLAKLMTILQGLEKDDQRIFIVCVNGPLPPPDGWRPS